MGEKRVMKTLKEHALQVIDAQAGRLRYDFIQRLDRSKLEFRWQMPQTIEATIEGIETAIRNGMS